MLLQKFSKNMPPSRIKRRKKKNTFNMAMEDTLPSNGDALIRDIQSRLARKHKYTFILEKSEKTKKTV